MADCGDMRAPQILFFAFFAPAGGVCAAALPALAAFFWLPPAAFAAEAPPAGIAAPKASAPFAAEDPARAPASQTNSYTAKCEANFRSLFKCYKTSSDSILPCIPGFQKEVSEADKLWNQLSEGEKSKIKSSAAAAQKDLNNIAASSQRSLTDCLNKGVLSKEACEESAAMMVRKALSQERLAKICGA